jgi:hypothetical protein
MLLTAVVLFLSGRLQCRRNMLYAQAALGMASTGVSII